MTEQDLSTMRNAYEAFNRSDIPAVLRAFDPLIEWHEPGGGSAPKGDFHGAESVVNDVFSTIPQQFEEFEARPDGYIDGSEQLVVVGTFHGSSKTGQQLEARYAHVWQMREGKAISFTNHVDAVPWANAWSAT